MALLDPAVRRALMRLCDILLDLENAAELDRALVQIRTERAALAEQTGTDTPALHVDAGQKPRRGPDPPRNDYRRDDAALHPEIDAVLFADPRLTATEAVRRLIAASRVKGSMEASSKLRRVVRGYVKHRPEMRHRRR